MCGIAGIVSVGRPIAEPEIAAMNRCITHRGPDDGGEWVSADGRVALANRRLAILDLSPAGHQPMSSADGRTQLAFNGEIYNYLELREELASLGHRFRTQTDTEVILAAYDAWGEQCVERFNGMFAFALWDAQKRVVFAARDRFGEKPFYYVRAGERVLFASEIKSLLADPDVPRAIDHGVAARYLTLALLDCDDRTFFDGIRQLPAAHAMTIDATGRIAMRRYWDLDLDRPALELGETEAAEQFRDLFTDAIRLRLRSDVAVGSSLSGGLDSSSIVCTMRALLASSPSVGQKTFSARYRNSPADEGRFIDAVVAKSGVEPHSVFIEPADLAAEIDQFIWHQDEPVAHTSQFAQWKVMQLARDRGVIVLLDGQGADEIIGGYPSPTFGYRYAELLTRGRVAELTGELRAFAHNHGSVMPALRYLGGALVPEPVRGPLRARAYGTSDLASGAAPAPPFLAPGGGPRLRRALYQTLTVTSLPGLLRYGDRNSMAFSREARLPFLDHRLVEFVYALPPQMLVRNGATKVILRRAMSGIIPDIVRDRMDKIGFATPERAWLLGPLRERVEGALSDLRRRQLVPPAAIDRHWQALVAGHGRSGNVWRMANLEMWMQKFLEGRPARAAA